jgi:hypothetical protein
MTSYSVVDRRRNIRVLARNVRTVITNAMPRMPSLSLLSDEVASELAAQERRGDALDSKAGVLLGFAGVLVGLTIGKLHGFVAHSGAVLAGVAGLLSAVAFIPRSYPTLALRRLREGYLTAETEFTRRRVMDTRIAMYERTQGLLQVKARLVTAAAAVLCTAVIVTVIGSIV